MSVCLGASERQQGPLGNLGVSLQRNRDPLLLLARFFHPHKELVPAPSSPALPCTSQHILARNKGVCSVYEDFMDIRERRGGNKVGRQAPALWPASSSRVWPSPLADTVVTAATEAREAWAVAQRLQGQINPG